MFPPYPATIPYEAVAEQALPDVFGLAAAGEAAPSELRNCVSTVYAHESGICWSGHPLDVFKAIGPEAIRQDGGVNHNHRVK